MNRVFPTETLEADTLWFARQLAGMPDASIHLTKNIMNALADGNLEACLEAESTASPFCTTTKRTPPPWRNLPAEPCEGETIWPSTT